MEERDRAGDAGKRSAGLADVAKAPKVITGTGSETSLSLEVSVSCLEEQ